MITNLKKRSDLKTFITLNEYICCDRTADKRLNTFENSLGNIPFYLGMPQFAKSSFSLTPKSPSQKYSYTDYSIELFYILNSFLSYLRSKKYIYMEKSNDIIKFKYYMGSSTSEAFLLASCIHCLSFQCTDSSQCLVTFFNKMKQFYKDYYMIYHNAYGTNLLEDTFVTLLNDIFGMSFFNELSDFRKKYAKTENEASQLDYSLGIFKVFSPSEQFCLSTFHQLTLLLSVYNDNLSPRAALSNKSLFENEIFLTPQKEIALIHSFCEKMDSAISEYNQALRDSIIIKPNNTNKYLSLKENFKDIMSLKKESITSILNSYCDEFETFQNDIVFSLSRIHNGKINISHYQEILNYMQKSR